MTRVNRSLPAIALVSLLFLVASQPLNARAQSAPASPAGASAETADQPDSSTPPAPAGSSGESQAKPPAGDLPASLDRARELLKNGDYDGAIEMLRALLQSERHRGAAPREVYLLLIETHVQLGNYFRFKDQGRASSDLNYQEARKLIRECLGTKELRHVRPEPVAEYSEETIRFFAEIRSEVSGSFRVAKLVPGHAVVLLDGDTLRASAADRMLGDVDIPVGSHQVVVRARGYKDVSEKITISPNSTSERSYALSRKHGTTWYAAVGAGVLAVAGGVVALTSGGNGSTPPPVDQPLPGAPPPPSGPAP